MRGLRSPAAGHRDVDQLSGGQRQRAWITMAVAPETDLLLLDEPTTYLGIAHQLDVLEVIADLNRERGRTIVVVLYDLKLASRYADHIVAMRAGRLLQRPRPRWSPPTCSATFSTSRVRS